MRPFRGPFSGRFNYPWLPFVFGNRYKLAYVNSAKGIRKMYLSLKYVTHPLPLPQPWLSRILGSLCCALLGNTPQKTFFANGWLVYFMQRGPFRRHFSAYILLKVDEIPRSEVIELFQKCQGMPDIVQLDMTAYIYSFGFRNLLNTWKAAIHRYKVGHSYYSHGLQSYYRLKGTKFYKKNHTSVHAG